MGGRGITVFLERVKSYHRLKVAVKLSAEILEVN